VASLPHNQKDESDNLETKKDNHGRRKALPRFGVNGLDWKEYTRDDAQCQDFLRRNAASGAPSRFKQFDTGPNLDSPFVGLVMELSP
jgi:hypothetical protein